MKWLINEYDPTIQPVLNRSSRIIDKSIPNSGALSLTGSLAFGSIILGVVQSVWLEFTNTGTKQLKDIQLVLPEEFVSYGTVPSVLGVGDNFFVRVEYTPTLVDSYSGNIQVKSWKEVFEFPYSATVGYGNFTHNDTVSYNGQQTYDGELNV